MENKKTKTHAMRRAALLCLLPAVFALSGCSHSMINYQVAEAIGTVGKYENNEPVETPKMQAQRESEEAREAAQAVLDEQIAAADSLAASYRYDEAIDYLKSITQDELNREQLEAKMQEYENAQNSLTPYEGTISHLCFPILIEDTARAFDADAMASVYDSSMVTTSEFKAILESLYEKNYVLVNMKNIAVDETDDRGVTTLELQKIMLPSGKKPIVISQDNLNYADIINGDGIATKLVLDEGKVKALYTDPEGHDLKGDYDLIPILDAFVEEHPDFSYRGAKGVVSVSGSKGAFGYQVASSSVLSNGDKNREDVQAIAAALTKSGWEIACAGYSHSYMNDMSIEQLKGDIGQWKEEIGSLVGETAILFYPYGAEVGYPSEGLTYLKEEGFQYLCGLWGDTDYMEMGDGYMRQTRRFVDGYTLINAPSYFTDFFLVSDIKDPQR